METKARFCTSLQDWQEILAEDWKKMVEEEKFLEATERLVWIDRIEVLRRRLKCPE